MKDAYRFTGEVKKQVDAFKVYLKGQRLNENTIRQNSNYAGYFLGWLETERLQPESTRYNDMLSFVAAARWKGGASGIPTAC